MKVQFLSTSESNFYVTFGSWFPPGFTSLLYCIHVLPIWSLQHRSSPSVPTCEDPPFISFHHPSLLVLVCEE